MPLWVRLLLAAIGLIFLVVGVALGLFGANAAGAEAGRAAALTPIGLAQLEDLPAGRAVLVEGLISARNPKIFREFAAYTVSEITGYDDDGDPEWEIVARETPRLLIEAGGLLQLANSDYEVEGDQVIFREAGGREAASGDAATRIYSGFAPLQPVTAVGEVAAGQEGNELRARVVFGGSQADYVAAQRRESVFLRVFGGLFAAAGLGITALPLWDLLQGRRRTTRRGTIT